MGLLDKLPKVWKKTRIVNLVSPILLQMCATVGLCSKTNRYYEKIIKVWNISLVEKFDSTKPRRNMTSFAPRCLASKSSASAWTFPPVWNSPVLAWWFSGLSTSLAPSLDSSDLGAKELQVMSQLSNIEWGTLISGNWVWAVIWSIANIVVYGAVVFGMMKTKKILLLPALIVSVFDVVVGALNCIINFVSLSWFA